MMIHGYGPSKKEAIILGAIAIVTLPIWLPAWGIYRVTKKIKEKSK